jgi:lycopene cyclase domain-containing protein
VTQYLYLALDIFSFIVPFAFSFHPRADFSKKWKYVLPAIITTAIIFIAWDEYFTQLGVWGFNRNYLCGIFIFSLPIEEVLFFFCIPYACAFTYFALANLIPLKKISQKTDKPISLVLILLTLSVGIYFFGNAYTAATFIALSILLTIICFAMRSDWMMKFYLSFTLLLIPFFLVNGILTGSFIDSPVVWYDDSETIGLRIGTIPVEDIFYAMLMILMGIAIAETLESLAISKKNSPVLKGYKK